MQRPPVKRDRYQSGSIEKIKTSDGFCWYLRYFERRSDGTKRRVRVRLGLLADLPSKAAAERAATAVRKHINDAVDSGPLTYTMADVIRRYRAEEIDQLAYTTRRGYERMIRRYIEPQWGSVVLGDLDAADCRAWLRGLDLSTKSRGHIHGLIKVLFRFAMLWKYCDIQVNPMSLFRLQGSQTRTRKPRILTLPEVHKLCERVKNPLFRDMILIDVSLGLRCSELTGLKWKDIDWMRNIVLIQRGVAEMVVGEVKTPNSEAFLPLDPRVLAILQRVRRASGFTGPEDWVFANPQRDGKRPYASTYIQTKVIKPAAKAAGLGEGIGWHTFRHSYKTLLDSAGVEGIVKRDLMRHSDIRTTENVYGQVRVERLRAANQKVVDLLLGAGETLSVQ